MKSSVQRFIGCFFLAVCILGHTSIANAQVTTKLPVSFPKKTVNYTLPYPGLLPDHPLYFLKAIRDRILDVSIGDPAKKTEFYMLMADKRLGMGIKLMESGKKELAYTTVSKGEIYLTKAVESFIKAKMSQRGDTSSLLDKLTLSSEKHKETLEGLAQKNPERKDDWNRMIQSLTRSIKDLQKLK